MKNKICVVTGANAGIGFETALALAKAGARVFLVGRDPEKLSRARENIQIQTQNNQVDMVVTDLSSQVSIRKSADQIMEKTEKIDVLVNNAGTWFSKLSLTHEGIEMQFAVNHLAYFLLTHKLLGHLAASGEGRIINVSSDSHFKGKMNFDDLNLTKKYHGLRAYAQSKLGNVLFTYALDRRLKERDLPVSVNAVQPGLVKTDIGMKHTISLHGLAWKIRRMGGVSPAQGAQTSIYLASSPEVKGVSGKYWDKSAAKPSSKRSYNEEDANTLWDISLGLTGISDYFDTTPGKSR